MADQRRIILLGKTGHGKSSSGNTILGDSSSAKFKTKSSPTSVTRNCEVQRGHGMENQTEIKIIDTPGFFDTHMSDEELKPEILKCMALNSPGPHAFIIVLRVERYTEENIATVAQITRSFGECAFKYTVVLFTHGNDLDEGQTIEQFVEQSEALKELVEKCGGGCHVIDNKYWNQEHEYRSNRVQVEKLLNTIEEMVRQNGGDCYTNEMLQAVEEGIQREEEEIRNENPNEKSVIKIRDEAIHRLTKKLLATCAGLAAGALLGALLGFGTKAVAGLEGVLSTEMASAAKTVVQALEGTTGGHVATNTRLYVPGGIVGAAAAGAIRGSFVGAQAVEDGDTVCDAVKKAVSACVAAEAKRFVEGTTINKGENQ